MVSSRHWRQHEVSGKRCEQISPALSLSRGVCYFPADRVAEASRSSGRIRENVSLVALRLPTAFRLSAGSRRGVGAAAHTANHRAAAIRPPNPERTVANLSGGNRQKVMLARGLTRDFQVFLFDEPTIGIDVGAKIEVYNFMKSLVEAGAAIVLVSSELPEVLHLSNRVYVMHRRPHGNGARGQGHYREKCAGLVFSG